MKIISFLIEYTKLNFIDNFIESFEIENVSIFEYPDLGYSKDLVDEDGLPVTIYYKIEIFTINSELKKIIEDSYLNNFIADLKIQDIDNNDWVREYTSQLKPLLIEDFFIYSDYYPNIEIPSNTIPIKIRSALAFGSGDHQTTYLCISLLCYLKNNITTPNNILDMGSGTGILGICAGKIWKNNTRIIAIDIDEEAVIVAKDNFKINNVEACVYQGSNIDNVGKSFDLIICNILKKPLEDMAESFYNSMNKEGKIIISGFITSQYEDISRCYENIGFKEIYKRQKDDWLAILYTR